METLPSSIGKQDREQDKGAAFSARDEQMEQDRAQAIFVYQQNWRGKPLINATVIVNLIGSTKTKTGLKVTCVLDKTEYKTSRKVSDKEYNIINIREHQFHGEWNYTISPQFT
jgi:hypothetical protein